MAGALFPPRGAHQGQFIQNRLVRVSWLAVGRENFVRSRKFERYLHGMNAISSRLSDAEPPEKPFDEIL
jgi:hypothetical protein